jgi:hypothetical protein
MGRYRYQILDTIDSRVLKKSIDTGKKYRLSHISEPAIFFILVSGLIMKMMPKSLNRRKYYQSSSFSMVLNGPQAGSEFVVMLVTIMKIDVLKTYSTSMILASKR